MVYKDEDFIENKDYRLMIRKRRVDNDVDSDDENMYAGMGYLYNELLERVYSKQ